jgi:hypothetical protein
MKKNLLGIFALALTIAVSSFTVKKVTNRFLIYKGTGAQTALTSYNSPVTAEPADISGGAVILNWFRVVDVNNNGIDGTEFQDAFDQYNQVDPSLNTLNDETSEIDHELDLKSL